MKQHRFWAWGAVICMIMVMVTGRRDLSIVAIGNLACVVRAYIMHNAFERGYTGRAAVP